MLETAKAEITKAVNIASVAAARYARYSTETRRKFNKAIFDAIYIREKRIDRYDYAESDEPVMATAASLSGGSNKDTLVELIGHYSNRD